MVQNPFLTLILQFELFLTLKFNMAAISQLENFEIVICNVIEDMLTTFLLQMIVQIVPLAQMILGAKLIYYSYTHVVYQNPRWRPAAILKKYLFVT